MMIDRVVLHGAPGVDPGVPYIHLLDRPYEGDPPLTMTLPMRRLDGLVVTNIEVHYTYTGTDGRGIPHYRTRAAGGAVLKEYSHERNQGRMGSARSRWRLLP